MDSNECSDEEIEMESNNDTHCLSFTYDDNEDPECVDDVIHSDKDDAKDAAAIPQNCNNEA